MEKLWFRAARLMLLTALVVLVLDAAALGLMFHTLGWGMLAGLTYRVTRRRFSVSGSHGTARTAGLPDLLAGRLLSDRGLILGRVSRAARPTKGQAVSWLLSPRVSSEWAMRVWLAAFGGRRRGGELVRITDYVHLATFAPAGGGKSVSVLYPNLLSYPGSCVVVDPKGELYRLTHKHRKREFGHTIVRLDPDGLCGKGADRFNPLDWVDPSRADFIDTCRDLANQVVVRSGKEQDPHWCDSAENAIAALTAFVCALEGNKAARDLRGVRALLASRENFERARQVMQAQSGFHGVLEELGGSLGWHVDRELGSVMSHAQRFTHIFGSPLVAESIGSTTFDPMKLRNGRMTIYLIAPPDKMVTWAPLQRLWIGSLLRIITRGAPTERNPVLFLIDECAHMGHMQALEDAVTLMRGMGIRLWLFFQSIEQLKKCFADNAGTVLDNLATQQYFSINSFETAEAISKRIGDSTIVIQTQGSNRGDSFAVGGDGRAPGNRSTGTSISTQETARRLLMPNEVLTLPEQAQIVFHKNNYAIVCDKIRYYSDRAFRQRGILFRRYGTGKQRGQGLSGLAMGLLTLALALAATGAVARLAKPQRRAAVVRALYRGIGLKPYAAPASYRPGVRHR